MIKTFPPWSRLYTFEGETLPLKRWAKKLGVSHSTLLRRIAKFGDSKEALPFVLTNRRYPNAGGKPKYYSLNGRALTIRELSERYNVKQGKLRDRLSAGWSVEDACSRDTFAARSRAMRNTQRCIQKAKGTLMTIDGVEDTFNGHARRKGLCVKTAKERVFSLGWSKEEALKTPTLTHEEICEKSNAARKMDMVRKRLAAFGVF